MNAKAKRWESYVDEAGRRHWRWPALAPAVGTAPGSIDAQRLALPRPRPQSALLLSARLRGR